MPYKINSLLTFIFFAVTYQAQAQLPGPFWTHTKQFPTTLSGNANISIACNKTNNFLFVGTIKSGIFRSTDHGDSWQNVLVLTDTAIVKILISNGIVRAIAGHYVFQSNDNGNSWTRHAVPTTFPLTDIEVHTGTIIVSAAAIVELSPSVWDYAGDGIYISNDQGLTWTQKNSGLPHRKGITQLAVSSTGVMYCAMSSFDGLGGGLYYSVDSGNSWLGAAKPAYSSPNNSTQATVVHDVFCLELDKHDSIYFSFEGIAVNVLVSAGLKNSLNNINGSWSTVRLTQNGFDWQFKPFYSMFFVQSGSRLYASLHTVNSTIQGGPYHSAQGNKWTRIPSGMLPVNNGYLKVSYADDSQSRLYAIQMTDHRVYVADTAQINLLSLDENSGLEVRMFPNPSDEEVHVILDQDQSCKAYELIDCNGKVSVSSKNIQASNFVIPLKDLPAGVYIIRFEINKRVVSHKLIKKDNR